MENITKEQIVNVVCEVCGIVPDDLKRRTKGQDIVMARHFIAHYMFSLLNCPIRMIAQTVGVARNTLYEPLFHNTIADRCSSHALMRERQSVIQEQLSGIK